MADEFRDAIAAARVWMPGVDAQDYHCGVDMADAILASPEMQAIKAFLTEMHSGMCIDLGDWGLPDNVIEWVLS